MAMSDDYYKKTKPNGMPDYVWQAQQAAIKAEEEAAKAKAEAEAAAKKKAEAEAKAKKEAEAKAKAEAEAKAKKAESTKTTTSSSSKKTGEYSEDYYSKTKPNGMPDSVWQEQQAAKKAEEEAAKLDASVFKDDVSTAIRKAAEEAAAKAVAQSVANGNYLFYDDIIPQEMVDGFKQYQTEKAVEDAIAYAESQKANNSSSDTKTGTGSVITGGMPLAGFSVAMDKAAQTTVDSGGEKDPITDAFVETLLGSDKMQENYKNAEEGSLAKDKADAALEKYSQKEGVSQEVLNQINSLLQNNLPTVDPYVPSDYVSGTYTPLFPQGDVPSNQQGGTSTGTQGGTAAPAPTLSTTSDEVAKYALAIMQAAKGDLGEVIKPEYMEAVAPNAPELRTLEELANLYGITYDYDSIYKLLNDSVEKQYDAIYAKQAQSEGKYYDNAAAAQNTLLDTLARDRGSAVQSGVSKGMQAANALGAMLGVSQQFADNATALSQERSNTAKDYGASLAKAMVDAEATSNERKNAIMEIAKMLYGYDSEQYVANMDSYNTILTNNAALQQTYMNNHSALQNSLASIFNNSASSKITGDANIQSNKLVADANIQASQNTAEANRLAAQYAAEAQRYAAYQAAEASKMAAQYAAQGNVDAYKEYANALIQQAQISAGSLNNALAGNEIPSGTGSSSGTSTVDTISKEIAKEQGVGYTNIHGVPLSTIYNSMPAGTKYKELSNGAIEVTRPDGTKYIMQ